MEHGGTVSILCIYIYPYGETDGANGQTGGAAPALRSWPVLDAGASDQE